ncbi:MAG: PAS domain S-box protein [Pseudomonadales bacterium]|nr:PAS domain S-box protein [Pseudomonadales bacterium]
MSLGRARFAGPLARRLGFSVLMIVILVTALTSTVYLYRVLQADLDNLDKQLDEVRSTYLASIATRVWVSDIESLKLDLAGMLNLKSLKYLSVTENGRTLVEVGVHPQGEVMVRNYPIVHTYRGEQLEIGGLAIEASTESVYGALYDKALFIIFVIAGQTFLVAGLVLLLVTRRVTRPLEEISTFAGRMELSNLDQKLILNRKSSRRRVPDELDVLVESFNSMQHALNESVQTLRGSEENLALTLNCIGDGVIATDIDGLVTRMNPIAERLTGWSSSLALGRSILDVFPIVDAMTLEVLPNPILQTLDTGEIITLVNSTTLRAKDKKEYQIADSAAPIIDEGVIIGAILVFHDVTGQYEMRESLRDSEQRLKSHVENTPLAVIEWNRDFRVSGWNPAAQKIFGFTPDEVMGLSASEIYSVPHERVNIEERQAELLSNNPLATKLAKHTTKGGKAIFCEWISTPLVNEMGQVIGAASLVEDITQRVHSETENLRQRLEQKQLLDNMLDAIISIDEEGTILSYNQSAVSMFGYKETELLGQGFSRLLPAEVALEYLTSLSRYIDGVDTNVVGRPHEIVVMRKDGEKFPVRLSVAPLPNSETGTLRFVACLHDIRIEKQIEEQLRRSQKLEALGKFSGGIAHDYNNMLAIVLGYTELLHRGLSGQPDMRGFVEQIRQAGERGRSLTKKLLTFSRQHPIEVTALDLNIVLTDQQLMLEKILTARISVKMDLTPDLWTVWLDKGDFEDVLVNLCINAMHAMSSTEDAVIVLKTSNHDILLREGEMLGLEAGQYVKFSISDNGSGMENETTRKIFDPFFTTKGDEGTGLGLTQVYGFVERSGGAIHAYSEPGAGARFDLYFPRYVELSEVSVPTRPDSDFEVGGSETILVVDDEPGLCALGKELFVPLGYEVFTANGADEALSVLEAHSVDFMLCDVVMPQMDGYRLAEIVKERFPGVKIQLISGFDDPQRASERDAELYRTLLFKPYRAGPLLKRVREILDGVVF